DILQHYHPIVGLLQVGSEHGPEEAALS
uniref:Uncharacterized protein n=1 Tax=Otolemur garnettii TaxID=30611 RepID=H0XSK6_OTOGA